MYGIVNEKDLSNILEWDCSEAAKAVLNEIVKNIKMCFDFYTHRCAGEKIGVLYLIGGGSQLRGLTEYMEEIFDIPVYPVSSLGVKRVEFAPGLNMDKVNFLINAIGVAL
jgi:type IV pilus assembly protein PilM